MAANDRGTKSSDARSAIVERFARYGIPLSDQQVGELVMAEVRLREMKDLVRSNLPPLLPSQTGR